MTKIYDDRKYNMSYSTGGASKHPQIFSDEEDEPEEGRCTIGDWIP